MFKGYVISDIHFGAMNSKELFSELNKVFIKKIKNDEEKIDLVVINGDLLDHKLSFNSEDSKLCINFINKLTTMSKKQKFAIRLIKGTKNHDLDQLNNFVYLQKRADIDFKIINIVTEETLNNYKILYVPEEYMEDSKEYYNDYFTKKNYYDISFVHGTFNQVEFVSKLITSERPIASAPIFSYKQFSKFTKGPIICGHIHIAQSFKKKIYYTGSFSRWKFGEDKKKGFMKFIIDDNDNYEVKFIENKLAPKYETIDISDIENMNEESLNKKIEEIKKYKKENDIQHLRININKGIDETSTNLDILKKYFSQETKEDIKVSVKNNVERSNDDNNELEEKYSFIFKNEEGIYKILSKYLKIHDNITLSESIIEDLLTSED